MAIVINSASQITLTGGTVGIPLLMTHLTTLANWPVGTTQATVDSYITRTANSYTFNIKAGKLIMCQGYLDQSDATIKHEGTNSYIVADNGGVITGGKYVGGKVFNRTTWLFDIGAQGDPHPTSASGGFLRGSGQINMVGLRVQNNSQQPGATGGHTGIVFWAGSTGSYNLQDLEILSEGNSPVYATFNTDNPTAGSSVVKLKEARVGVIRHGNINVSLSFGDGGWIGGDGSTKNKLLIPTTQTTYEGLAPVFQNAGDIINITNKNFGTPSFVAKNAQLEKGRITMYPNATTNRAEIQRTFNFKLQNLTGSQINNAKIRATSQRIVTTGGVPASAVTTQLFDNYFNYNTNQDVTVWLGTGARTGTGDGTYLLPNIVTDDTNISLLFRHTQYFEQTASTNSELGSATFTNALVTDTYYTSDQSANTTIAINSGTKTITLTGANTLDNLYDYIKYWLTQNMSIANFMSASGKNVNITDYQIVGLQHLTSGTKLTSIQSTGTITAIGAFAIEVIGAVSQATPTNLPATAKATTLTYNTNMPATVSYATGVVIGTLSNDGTAIVSASGGSVTTYTDAEINFLDSNLSAVGITSATIYGSQSDRDTGANAGATFTTSLDFKYGSVVSGVTMQNTVYLRVVVGSITLFAQITLVTGSNTLDLGVQGQLSAINAKVDLTAKETTLLQTETDIIAEINANETKIDTLQTSVDNLPTLSEIEASTELAKESSVQLAIAVSV